MDDDATKKDSESLDEEQEAASSKRSKRRMGQVHKFVSSPWAIAILAPVLTAAIFGVVHLVDNGLQNAGQPLARATATYNGYYAWEMSSPIAVEMAKFGGKVKNCDSLRQWLLTHGSGDLAETRVRLHLVGTQNETVTIEDVHAQVLSRSPDKPQAIVDCPSAGTVATPEAAFNLEDRVPIALLVGAPYPNPNQGYVPGTHGTVWIDGKLGQPYFSSRIITLTKGEPFDIPITAFISGSEVIRWRVAIDIEIGSEQRTIIASSPIFVTAPLLCHYRYDQYLDWRWDLNPQRLEPNPYPEGCSSR